MKMNKNKPWNLAAALSLVAVLGLSGTAAQAAVSIPEPALSTSTVDAVSQPGSQALPSFVFNFDSNFDLIGFDITVQFDPTKLSFNAAASTLSFGASTVTLPAALMAMQTALPDFIFSPGAGDFGTAINTGEFSFNGAYFAPTSFFPVPAGSSVTLTGVFDLLPGFDTGSTPVRVFGNASDQFFAFEEFDMTASVSAVPEPETWLMLIGGLGLIASRVRRRAKTQ
ncbi:MAG: PEPxxWA-CTERM sorting domain-containing protein [Rhodoferax sp.]|nr:PEPxxWA-CTERM sorting domain-containing protein [Rhodoferax sp.]MCW5628235.1 PEPxxWA-CTERM sorting domain-containing protein [Rhodoferax sp.]